MNQDGKEEINDYEYIKYIIKERDYFQERIKFRLFTEFHNPLVQIVSMLNELIETLKKEYKVEYGKDYI